MVVPGQGTEWNLMTPPEAPAPPEAQTPQRRGTSAAWAWPVAWMVIASLLIGGGLYVFKSCRDLPGETLDKSGKLVQTIGQQVQQVAGAFKQGTITSTFTSYATTLSGS